MSAFEKIVDLFMFRNPGDSDNETNHPVVTTGSIIWGALLRSSIIIVSSMLLLGYIRQYEYWWIALFALWFFAAFPAYRQYQSFNDRIKKLEESTLCGSCRHFNSGGQLCNIYDEHVSSNYIPCEGADWEPK